MQEDNIKMHIKGIECENVYWIHLFAVGSNSEYL